MITRKYLLTFFAVMLMVCAPVRAEEPATPVAENASESGKNEIPVCAKLVPISVTLSSEYPEKDREFALNKYEVPKRLEYAIACQLEREGYSTVKPFEIAITITSFRLRLGGTAAMLGIMAGVDRLGVDVIARAPDQTELLKFDAKTKTAKGGFIAPVPTQRLNLMVQDLASSVVVKIKKKGLLKNL
jgi:hypothetical protein